MNVGVGTVNMSIDCRTRHLATMSDKSSVKASLLAILVSQQL
jgi:hypothetical protein